MAESKRVHLGMPGWVKAFIWVGIAALILVGILLVPGGHGPGQHTGSH